LEFQLAHIGKLLGAFFGYLFGGGVGLIAGVIIGHYFDRGMFFQKLISDAGFGLGYVTEAQRVFFESTFLILGHIAKADGRVSEREIQAARAIMRNMRLNENQKKRAVELFGMGKQPQFKLHPQLLRLRKACHNQRMLLRIFIDIQLQGAAADGFISPIKKKLLEETCRKLGFKPNFLQFHSYRQYEGYKKTHKEKVHRGATPALDNPYKILGITKKFTNAEIKKAYRKLMNENHPDKLVSKGLPEEMMKLATQRTQEIQKAYDTIKSQRGIK